MTVTNMIRKAIDELERKGIQRRDMRLNISEYMINYLKHNEEYAYLNRNGIGRGGFKQSIEGVIIESNWPFKTKMMLYYKDACWMSDDRELIEYIFTNVDALQPTCSLQFPTNHSSKKKIRRA